MAQEQTSMKVGQQVAQDKQADGKVDLLKPDRPPDQSTIAQREERLAYLLLLPTFVILFLIAIYPLGSVFYYSLTNRTFASTTPTEVVGLANYTQLLGVTIKELPPTLDEATGEIARDEAGAVVYERPINVLPREPLSFREVRQFNLLGTQYVLGASDRDFIDGTLATLTFTVLSVALETVLGLGIALVVNANFPGRGPMRVMMLVPWVIPTAVSARMWEYMFEPTRVGFFNVIFQNLGLGNGQIAWLESEALQLPAMIAMDVWKTTPFMALLLLAGLQLIPSDIYEAADVDGANPWQQFWGLTLPLLRPTLAVALIFRTLDALRVFDVFQIVLGQQRYSMASFAYYELINNRAMGYSAAASVVIFLLIFIFAVVYMRLLEVETD